MSKYNFIASDYEISEVDLTNVIRMTVKELKTLRPEPKSAIPLDELDEDQEVLYFETEADMDGLAINLCDKPPYNLDHYIKKRYVYWLNYRFTEKCAKQLVDFLKENMRQSSEIEIWSIWFGDIDEINEVKNIKSFDLINITEHELMDIRTEEICIRIIN